MNTAIIIPAYNEANTIREVISDFHNTLPDAVIYVINNNSDDATSEIAAKALKDFRCTGEVMFEERRGKSNAIRKAFADIDSDIYVMVDGDMTYSAESMNRLMDPVLKCNADMVVGDRLSNGGYDRESDKITHRFGNKFIRKLINVFFKSNLKDVLSGYRVFNRRFVKTFPIMQEGFTLETEMTLHALDKRLNIVEIPIDYKERRGESISKINTYRDGMEIIRMIIAIFKNYKPLAFFSIVSFLFFIFGLLAGMPALTDYIEVQYIRHVPLAILATGLMLFSLISLSIGLILDTFANNYRFQYELLLLRYK